MFDEWIAYYLLEPFGQDHFQMANIMCAIFNAQGGKKGNKPFQIEDFITLPPDDTAKVTELEEQERHLLHWKMYAGMVNDNPGLKERH